MKAIVTCGPGYAPIDEVRRITNFSTGNLGVQLCRRLEAAGIAVACLKGEGASANSEGLQRVVPFSTNDDLLEKFRELSREGEWTAVFQCAALCDYQVASVSDAEGNQLAASAKIPSRAGNLILELEPAAKVLPQLRDLFPKALLIGWKYELVGDRNDALAKGWRQIESCRSDACVVNGRAYGEGFGICRANKEIIEVADRPALVDWLTGWTQGRGNA